MIAVVVVQNQKNLFCNAVGLFSRISSISFIISSVNLGMISSDFMVCVICSGLEAPVMAEETFGFLTTQAMASAAWSQPSLSAIGCFRQQKVIL